MWQLAPKPKRRHTAPRSFTGCSKCRIKCDETKPECHRCLEKGFTCPGLTSQLRIRWSRKHEVEAAPFEAADGYPALTWSLGSDCDPLAGHRADLKAQETSSTPKPASLIQFSQHEAPRSLDDEPLDIGSTHRSNYEEILPVEHEFFSLPDIGLCGYQPVLGCEGMQQTSSANDTQLSFENLCTGPADEQFEGEKPNDDGIVMQSSTTPESSAFEFDIEEGEEEDIEFTWTELAEMCEPNPSSSQLVDLPSELVQIYFTTVCPRFSTFDSRQNLFRSFVDGCWQSSSAMFYTILSMAAAKLSHQRDDLKKPALRYQTLALQELSCEVSSAPCWTTHLLFVVLMLGLSACWHTMPDLGLVHLQALRHALRHTKSGTFDGSHLGEFFENALTYWEMVTGFLEESDLSSVWEEASTPSDNPKSSHDDTVRIEPIVPHPWTSTASKQQKMFSRICRVVRHTRAFGLDPDGIRSMIAQPVEFLHALDSLDEELWNVCLPGLHDIANTGDNNTPAIHHVLIAEAYMFANMYQLYSIFPHLRRRRVKMIKDPFTRPSIDTNSWAHAQLRTWSSILAKNGGDEHWLGFLGRSIITRVEQISPTSGTSCLHSLPLVVGSTALPSSVFTGCQATIEDDEIHRMRTFVLDRLEFLSVYFMSERVSCARTAVLEIFTRLDVGIQVFWMDVLQALGVITVIG